LPQAAALVAQAAGETGDPLVVEALLEASQHSGSQLKK